jgi:hypothetical protein
MRSASFTPADATDMGRVPNSVSERTRLPTSSALEKAIQHRAGRTMFVGDAISLAHLAEDSASPSIMESRPLATRNK